MPIYSPTGFLDITNATLRTSNVEAQNLLMTGGNIYVTSELETNLVLNLENVTNKGNITSNTIQFTNTKTALVASSNVDVVGNVFAYKFIGSGAGLTNIPPSAITGTLSQWSDGTNGDVFIASNVGIGNVHTLTSNTLQVGGNLYVRDTDANVLTVNGNVVASYFEGDGSKLSGIVTDLQGVTNNGNVTTNVVQFSNATTGLVTTANVEVGGDVKIVGLTAGTVPYVGSDKFLKDSFITTTGDTTVITSNLDVTGNIFMRGEKFIVHSESKLINDAIIGIANNNTSSTTDKGIIMQNDPNNANGNIAIIHHGTGGGFADQLTFGYTADPLDTITVTNDLTKELTVNILGNVITQNNLSVGGTLKINNITAAAQHSLQAVTNVGNVTSNTIQFTNTFTSLAASSNIIATGNVSAGYDTDTTSHFGRAAVGYMGTSDHASFAHVDHNTTSDYAVKQTASGPTYINTPASGHIRFTVADGLSNAEKMRITNAGNVGIGASSPGYKLDVYGTANVGVLTATTVTTSGGATFNTNTLKVDAVNSRIGVGTTSPDEKLHVNGNIRLGGPQGTDEDASYYIKSAGQIHINSAADGTADDSYICLDLRAGQSGSNRSGIGICGAATNASYQHIAFETTDAERMRINYDGNVGIGTAVPSAKLQVGGNTETGPQYLWIRGHRVNQAGDICGIHFYNSLTSGDRGNSRILSSRGTNNYGSNLEFWTNPDSNVPATQRMCILANGNVGVGTTAPAAIFEVVGGYTTSPIKKSSPTAPTNEYNYFLNAPRPGTTSGGAVHFINGSTRNDDGGNSTYTVRNDSGQLRLGNSSYTTIFQGNHLRMAENDNSFFHFGPNGTWSGELYVGATSDRTSSSYTTKAQVISTDGNLHLDSGNARDIYMNYYRGNYIRHHGLGVWSDDRLKSEEEFITNATDTLLKLSPQKYLKRHTLREDEDRDPLVETGLIAQDIWYDAPELRHLVQLGDGANPTDIKPEAPVVGDIQQDPDYSSWGPKEASVNYNGLIAYLIKSNQELHNRIQALENA